MLEPIQRLQIRVKAGKLLRLPLKKLMLIIPITFVEDDSVPALRLHNNSITVSLNYTEDEIAYIIAHGSLYFQLRHHKRGKELCPKDLWPVWVLASELARTDILDNFGVNTKNKDIFLRPATLGLEPGKSAEEYYFALLSFDKTPSAVSSADYTEDSDITEDDDIFGSAQGQGEGTSAEGTEALRSGTEAADAADTDTDMGANIDIIINNTQRDIINAIGRGLLSSYGDLKYFKEENRDHVKIQNLRRLLMTECHAVSNSTQIKRYSSPRPRRRTLDPKIVLMDTIKLGQRVAVVVDVSGSTSFYRQEVFDTLAAVIRASSLVDVFIGDTQILEKHMKVKRPDQLKGLPDGGGTSMDAIILELDKLSYKAIFVVTDGITPWPAEKTKARVYACLIGEYKEEMKKGIPEWIRVV